MVLKLRKTIFKMNLLILKVISITAENTFKGHRITYLSNIKYKDDQKYFDK